MHLKDLYTEQVASHPYLQQSSLYVWVRKYLFLYSTVCKQTSISRPFSLSLTLSTNLPHVYYTPLKLLLHSYSKGPLPTHHANCGMHIGPHQRDWCMPMLLLGPLWGAFCYTSFHRLLLLHFFCCCCCCCCYKDQSFTTIHFSLVSTSSCSHSLLLFFPLLATLFTILSWQLMSIIHGNCVLWTYV